MWRTIFTTVCHPFHLCNLPPPLMPPTQTLLTTKHKLSQSQSSTTHAFSSLSSANPRRSSSSSSSPFPPLLPFHGTSSASTSANLQEFRHDNTANLHRRKANTVQQNPAVIEVLRLIDLRSHWNPKLEKRLQFLLRILKPEQVCEVLRSQKDERLSLQFFHWADRQRPYTHHPRAYYAILKQLSGTKLCQEAKKILSLMKRRGLLCEPEPFTYLMLSYSRAGHLEKTTQVLTMMKISEIQPDLTTYNTLLHAMVLQNHLQEALRLLETMQRAGVSPNIITYNCLIKGFCRNSMAEDALKMLDEMPCVPDKVTCCTIMGFFCKEKRIEELREFMVKMEEGRGGIVMGEESYIRLVHMLSKHGHGDEAMGFLREAEGKGHLLDKVAYTAVVGSYCLRGELDKAKKLVGEMSSKGHPPDVVTYTSVINGMCLAGKVDIAKKMLHRMYKSGCRPNAVSHTAFLAGLCRMGRSTEARGVVAESDGWWSPNSITYSVLVHGFHREGKMAEAREVMMEMIGKGFLPTPVEMNISIRSLCEEGRAEEGRGLLMEFIRKGCRVNVVNYTTVISAFCREGDVDAALSLMDDMYLCDKHPDVYTYTAVIGALGKSGRLVAAGDLAVKMLRRGVAPTQTTYRIIIYRYCEKDGLGDLLRLLERMLSRHPYRDAYNHVVERLCRFGKIEIACGLLWRVLKGSSRRNWATCTLVMNRCLEEGMYEEAYEVARKMFRRNMIPDLGLCEKVRENFAVEGIFEKADRIVMWLVERGVVRPTKNP